MTSGDKMPPTEVAAQSNGVTCEAWQEDPWTVRKLLGLVHGGVCSADWVFLSQGWPVDQLDFSPDFGSHQWSGFVLVPDDDEAAGVGGNLDCVAVEESSNFDPWEHGNPPGPTSGSLEPFHFRRYHKHWDRNPTPELLIVGRESGEVI